MHAASGQTQAATTQTTPARARGQCQAGNTGLCDVQSTMQCHLNHAPVIRAARTQCSSCSIADGRSRCANAAPAVCSIEATRSSESEPVTQMNQSLPRGTTNRPMQGEPAESNLVANERGVGDGRARCTLARQHGRPRGGWELEWRKQRGILVTIEP